MTRGRFYATIMPIWAILYAMGVVAFRNATFTTVGAMAFALIAVVGAVAFRGDGRDRNRNGLRGA